MPDYSFIAKCIPLSYNNCKGARRIAYHTILRNAFRTFYPTHEATNSTLYGALYYFYKVERRLDPDNMSKPFWDSLTGHLFVDDYQIKLRIAAGIQIPTSGLTTIAFTGMDGAALTALLDAIDSDDHILYAECGAFNHSMIRFNLH